MNHWAGQPVMFDARARGKTLPKVKTKTQAPTNVVNIMDVLQRSLSERRGKRVKERAGKSRLVVAG